MIIMTDVFPEAIRSLPEADIPIPGLTAYLSQDENHQIVFMYFSEDAEVLAHSHDAQWGIVLEGKIDLTVESKKQVYTKGDRFYILPGETHSAKIYAGYASMEFFADKDRYKAKE
jgi:quercetin dioxygenase-like cupin family protein